MGPGEEGTPTKSSKPASSVQEAPSMPATPAYPDWSSSMQAFYGAGATPPFFASTVASPTPHPFLWGGQHPLMPPYGTPVPYPALYPPGGVYPHPNMAPGNAPGIQNPASVHGNIGLDAKATEGKERALGKKAKRTAGLGGKAGESGKAASGSGNDVGTQSAESGSEGSSDASDENDQEFPATKKGSFDQMLADGANAQNNAIPSNSQAPVPGNPVPSGPVTNLNIGMDLWNPAAGSGSMMLRPSPPGVSPGNQSGYVSDQWIQDERELKRQKRKQSNRESARRSRLRKQAECEELQQRVECLISENRTLEEELQRLNEECKKLASENNSIKEELTKLCGSDDVQTM
ncbi:G-box-binding factor 1-like isoform X2 [Andrographis paniculata]|uniref:G-box-binding factor 1-like isoform X2 n=1 Tax=Andrographis paniculata TaxID=175694 RepID=UPI0021E85607|nr:G-box-binding factor 1-like isoform X2 [Andrographis paniculata]